jgi:hypothetical protein
MRTTREEALSLFNKWRASGATVIAHFSDGPPDSPQTFVSYMKGTIKQVSPAGVSISDGTNFCILRLDAPDIAFQFAELWDPRLDFDEVERELAGEMFEESLSVSWENDNFCVLAVLRKDG